MSIKTGILASALTYGLALSTAFAQVSPPFDITEEAKNNPKGAKAIICSAVTKLTLDAGFAGNNGDAVMVIARAVAQGTKAYGDADIYTLKAMSYKAFLGQGLADMKATDPSAYYANLSKLKQAQNMCRDQLDPLNMPEPRK
jgi:hypothetical protein